MKDECSFVGSGDRSVHYILWHLLKEKLKQKLVISSPVLGKFERLFWSDTLQAQT